jgi:5-methylcytosine-specific restriction endonuclease McrA
MTLKPKRKVNLILARLRNKTYRQRHGARLNEKQRELRARPEEKEKRKIWLAANRERINKRALAWLNAHPGKSREYQRRYEARYRDKARLKVMNRRRKLHGKLSAGLIDRLLTSQKYKCVLCRADLRTVKLAMDHIEPIKLGGPNIDSNIQLLCFSCNSKKSARPMHVVMQERGYLL